MTKILILPTAFVFWSVLIFSCGVPTGAYLYPPERTTEDFDLGKMTFENSTENDSDIFLGYMLIYRFYEEGDLPADSGDEDEWDDIGESFFSTSVLNSYDKEEERGYYSEVYNYSLFKVLEIDYADRTDAFTVTLDFSNLTEGKTTGEVLGTAFDLKRSFTREDNGEDEWIEDIEGDRIFFTDDDTDYDLTDSDLPYGVTNLSGLDLVCVVWAVSYGFDIYDTFQNVYSKAVYLGDFSFTIY